MEFIESMITTSRFPLSTYPNELATPSTPPCSLTLATVILSRATGFHHFEQTMYRLAGMTTFMVGLHSARKCREWRESVRRTPRQIPRLDQAHQPGPHIAPAVHYHFAANKHLSITKLYDLKYYNALLSLCVGPCNMMCDRTPSTASPYATTPLL